MNQYEPSKEELEAIQDNDADYFDGKYSETQKQGFLRESIARGKLDVIKLFVEQGVPLVNTTCLDSLAKKKKKVKIFEYLHSKGIDVAVRGNFPLREACRYLSVENADYLQQFSVQDSFVYTRTLTDIIYRDSNTQQTVPIHKFEPILHILLNKISCEKLNDVLNIKDGNTFYLAEENKKYILNLYLGIKMPDNKKDSKKIKI
jgi:hypothetical protein